MSTLLEQPRPPARTVTGPTHPLRPPLPGLAVAGDPAARNGRQETAALRFSVLCLSISLLASRFGLAFGSSRTSFVGIAVLGVACISLARGTLRLHRQRTALFILLCALTFASMAVSAIQPNRFGSSPSWPSLFQFLILTSFAAVQFARPLDETRFFAGVNSVFAFIAVAGIIQFFAQFAGLGLFSFRDFLPETLSFETAYNMQIPIGTTRYFKSNGFFLLEPSMFSQYMALGLAIEIAVLRRVRYAALMLAGLIVSLAGTGWMILGSFIIALVVGMKSRGVVLALVTVGLLGLGLAALAFAAPDFFESFASRIGEFSAPGSSGHARFVAPFWAVDDVISRAPWALWAGVGAGVGERLMGITYDQSPDTPIKILIEYGLPTMFAYLALIMTGRKTRAQSVLLVPGMVMLLLTGSYAQIPPMLYPVLLVVCIPGLVATPPAAPALPLKRVDARLRSASPGRTDLAGGVKP